MTRGIKHVTMLYMPRPFLDKKCSVEGCEKRHNAHGYCMMHYIRSRKGKPLDAPLPDYHGKTSEPVYWVWHAIQQRTSNPTNERYGYYSTVGVDPRWIKGDGTKSGFSCFYEDMGDRPKNMSIDRIDTNKGYYKENCRWTDASTQMQNQRKRPNTSVPEYRGVYYRSDTKKYSTSAHVNYVKYSFGDYGTPEEAAIAYDCGMIQLRGNLAQTNIL